MAHYLNMKTCRICKTEKSSSEFYISRKASDGLNIYCKACDNKKRVELNHRKKEMKLSAPKAAFKREPLPKKAAPKKMVPKRSAPVKAAPVKAPAPPKKCQLDQNFLNEALKFNKKCRDNIKKQQRKSILKIKSINSAEFLRISKSRVGDKSSVSALVIINKKPIKYISEYIENSQADDLILAMNNSPIAVAESLLNDGALL